MKHSLLLSFTICVFLIQPSIGQKTVEPYKTPTTFIPKSIIKDTVTLTSDTSSISLDPGTQILFVKENSSNSIFKDILPILTLLLGIGLNKFLDWVRNKKEITKGGERWVAEIRGLDEPIGQQIEVLEEQLQNDSEDEYDCPELSVMSTLDCEIFKSLDKSQMLKYIERKEKKGYSEAIKTSNQVHGLINILSHLHDSLKGKYNECLEEISLHTSTVNKNLQLLLLAFAWYGAALEEDLKNDPISDPHYGQMLELFNHWIEPHRHDGAYNLFELRDNFFQPLISVLGEKRHDEKIKDMTPFVVNCLNGIRGIQMEKKYWRKNMGTITERYKKYRSDLNNVVDKIEQCKG